MAAIKKYFEKKVSLLSTSDVRYDGELYTVDPSEQSIALKHGMIYSFIYLFLNISSLHIHTILYINTNCIVFCIFLIFDVYILCD